VDSKDMAVLSPVQRSKARKSEVEEREKRAEERQEEGSQLGTSLFLFNFLRRSSMSSRSSSPAPDDEDSADRLAQLNALLASQFSFPSPSPPPPSAPLEGPPSKRKKVKHEQESAVVSSAVEPAAEVEDAGEETVGALHLPLFTPESG
jgi:hypothetical protein